MHLMHEAAMEIRGEERVLQRALESARIASDGKIAKEEMDRGYRLFCNFYATDFYEGISEVVMQEEAVWSKLGGGFAGRVDLLARDAGGILKLVDFKSSRAPKKREWILGYEMQAAAYCAGLRDVKGLFPERAEIWISCETGDVQVFELNRDDLIDRLKKFHALVVAYHKTYEQETHNG